MIQNVAFTIFAPICNARSKFVQIHFFVQWLSLSIYCTLKLMRFVKLAVPEIPKEKAEVHTLLSGGMRGTAEGREKNG